MVNQKRFNEKRTEERRKDFEKLHAFFYNFLRWQNTHIANIMSFMYKHKLLAKCLLKCL